MTARFRIARGQRHERIDIENRRDVLFWAGKWGLTDKELQDAVAAVGPLAADVAAHIGQPIEG